MVRLLSAFTLGALLVLPACATTGGAEAGEDGVVYGSDAESNLKKGDEALEGKNFPEAQHYFEYVKTKYPFLDAAKTAELRLADTDFERERYIEARDRYQSFVRLHPTHAKVDYASFRAAQTHHKDMPSDFFLLPPSEEKDQVEVKNALVAMQEFVRLHPESPYVAEGKTIIADVKQRLANHELYVAGFYAKRERWTAVVSRLTVVSKLYPGPGVDEAVAFGLYSAYRHLQDDAKALEALRVFAEKNPEASGAEKARRIVAAAGPTTPPPASSTAPDAGT